jgi:hypothetical protein
VRRFWERSASGCDVRGRGALGERSKTWRSVGRFILFAWEKGWNLELRSEAGHRTGARDEVRMVAVAGIRSDDPLCPHPNRLLALIYVHVRCLNIRGIRVKTIF